MATRRLFFISAGLLGLGLGVSVLWVILTGGFESLRAIGEARPLAFPLLLGITTFHIGVRFVRWQFLLRRASVRLPARPSLSMYLASLAGTATPAYVGEAIRCVLARRKLGAPVVLTFTVLVFERLLDVATLALLATALSGGWGGRAVLAAVALFGVALFAALAAIARRSAFPFTPIAALRSPRTLVPAMLLSLACWVPATFSVVVAAHALGHPLRVFEGMRVFTDATLFGGITLMPAGLGATGSAAIVELRDLGLDLPEALPIVALFRLTTTGLSLSVGIVFLCIELAHWRKAPAVGSGVHFDAIAADYRRQYAPHVWDLLVERKTTQLSDCLPKPAEAAGLGLDFGCGLGDQCLALRRRGFRVVGMDSSRGLLRRAREAGAPVVAGDGRSLPFRDASFDFVYAVGVLHHLAGPAEQAEACRQIARVLKPGGVLLVHETNTKNPLFRFYMGYVFPILKTIDEGTEQWVEPDRWKHADGLELAEVRYFTFLPDTIPRPLLPAFLRLERLLEGSSLRPYAVHYLAVLRKP